MKVHLAHILKPSFRSLLFFLAAGMFLFSCEKNEDEPERSSEASMTSLTLTVGDTDYDVTFTGKEGKITLPYSTALPVTATVKAVALSAKAKGVKVGDSVTIPASGTVTLTVTAEDDKTKGVYTLTVAKASASKEASITALTLTVGDSDYKIDFTDRAYTLVLPAGSALPTAVGVKEITLSAGATGVANDDELPVTDNAVTITVTAEDGKTKQNYTVAFSVAANEGASITTLTLTAGSTDYDITFEGTQGSVTVPYGTALPTAVDVKEITLSDGATSDAVNGTALTVTDNAVTITVTAEDGETESEYTVTFSVAASSEASITSLTLTVGDTDYEIMFEDRQDTITLPYSTALPVTATVKTVTLSAKATGIKVGDAVTIPASGTVTLTVTAEDDKTTGVYTLTVEKASASKEASITSLTLTVGDADYEVTFEDMQGTLMLPSGTALPTAVGVKQITLSAGAASDAGNQLTVTDNAVTITVTAEDGTTTNTYTVSLAESMGFSSFTFEVTDNESMALDTADRQRIVGTVNQQEGTITFPDQSAYVYPDRLKATFTTSAGATVQVGGADQVSGVTEQDFSSPVSYVVRTADGTETTYTVTLTKSTMATIPDAQFRAKLKEFVPAAFTEDQLDITHADVVNNDGELDVRDQTPKLTSVKGIEFFTTLTYFNCYAGSLTSLDVSKNTSLTKLYCYSNALTSLDVRANTSLTYLDCSDNVLESLDVSKNTALTALFCYTNKLTSLDVSANTALKILSCGGNALKSLNVSKNTSLTSLSCGNNSLRSLDVIANTSLTSLNCGTNSLSSLDVSKNTSLTRLDCNSNALDSLDVTKNTALTELFCYANSLIALDITGMRSLAYPGALEIGRGTGTDNPLLATLRVNTAVQDAGAIINVKANRGAALTVTTVNNEGTEVCADYTPAQGGGTCN